jgi:hypothetical protein
MPEELGFAGEVAGQRITPPLSSSSRASIPRKLLPFSSDARITGASRGNFPNFAINSNTVMVTIFVLMLTLSLLFGGFHLNPEI